jgi:hypothetical protein
MTPFECFAHNAAFEVLDEFDVSFCHLEVRTKVQTGGGQKVKQTLL